MVRTLKIQIFAILILLSYSVFAQASNNTTNNTNAEIANNQGNSLTVNNTGSGSANNTTAYTNNQTASNTSTNNPSYTFQANNQTASYPLNNYTSNNPNETWKTRGQSCGVPNPLIATDCWQHSTRDNSCCFRTVNGNNSCLYYGYNISCCDNYIDNKLVYCGSSFTSVSLALISLVAAFTF